MQPIWQRSARLKFVKRKRVFISRGVDIEFGLQLRKFATLKIGENCSTRAGGRTLSSSRNWAWAWSFPSSCCRVWTTKGRSRSSSQGRHWTAVDRKGKRKRVRLSAVYEGETHDRWGCQENIRGRCQGIIARFFLRSPVFRCDNAKWKKSKSSVSTLKSFKGNKNTGMRSKRRDLKLKRKISKSTQKYKNKGPLSVKSRKVTILPIWSGFRQ